MSANAVGEGFRSVALVGMKALSRWTVARLARSALMVVAIFGEMFWLLYKIGHYSKTWVNVFMQRYMPPQ